MNGGDGIQLKGGTTTMSADSRDNLSMPARWKGLACAVAAFLAVGLSATSTVQAQDATPAGSPAAAECDAPELPPGTPTPMDTASPEATEGEASPIPEDETGDAAEATATEEEDAGTPAEDDTGAEITAAVENLAGCVNSGDYEGVAALLTEEFMMSEFGTGNPYDVALLLEEFGLSFANITVDNPRTYEDGSVSADVTYMASQYQIAGETWYLVQDGEYWKLMGDDEFTPEVDGDTAVVGVVLDDTGDEGGELTYSITPNAPSVAQAEVLIFHAVNQGTEDHELVVFKLPEGADPMGLLDGSIAESDVEFIGAVDTGPGGEVDMVLQGLPAGVYTMVCFFESPDGSPHAAHGMTAQFEVTAPAS
jgi:uncharacterized cupredoxin-like copper-binding protein